MNLLSACPPEAAAASPSASAVTETVATDPNLIACQTYAPPVGPSRTGGTSAPAPNLIGVISRLRGTAVARAGDRIVLDVGGVGYALAVTPTALRRAEGGGEVTLETYLHVREDALQLYGFGEPAERELFEHLLAVSGVGPKVALAIVSGSPVADLRRAIALEDTARFEAIPGIGKKTAQRVVLELKEKLGSVAADPEPGRLGAREALVELGYTVVQAEPALARLDPDRPAEEQVRQALKEAA